MKNYIKNSINVERAKRHMTQKDLADKIGISKQSISIIENSGNCKLPTAYKIANFFGLKIDKIWDTDNI